MKPVLRDYQQEMVDNIYQGWDAGYQNLGGVLATGSGKSVIISHIVDKHKGACVVLAHRLELVSQMSVHLARDGIIHRVIGSRTLSQICVKMHIDEFGQSFIDPQSSTAVASVQTIVRRGEELKRYLPTVSLWVCDEFHHLTRKNLWGRAIEMFTRPDVKGLGLSATPLRASGEGLGRSSDGVIDKLVIGTDMRHLINKGYLSDYRIFAPTSNLDLTDIDVSKTTGDYNINALRNVVNKSSLVTHDKSTLTGDIVKSYLKFAKDKLGLVFIPDMIAGHEITAQFNSVGVPACLVNAKTPDLERVEIVKKFSKREYMVLVNVDIFGEGTDICAVEVVSLAAPTQSFSRFSQRFGRALRPLEGKDKAIIIDHGGDVSRHGLPDAPREWTLDRRTKRAKVVDDSIPVRTCLKCFSVYESYQTTCPYCGTKPIPADRKSIKCVDGDLTELSPETLAEMRGAVDVVNSDINEQIIDYRQELLNNHCKPFHIRAHCNRKTKELQHQQASQETLRDRMAWYGGHRRSEGKTDQEIFKLFYLKFNISWIEAQSLPGDEADELYNLIGEQAHNELESKTEV